MRSLAVRAGTCCAEGTETTRLRMASCSPSRCRLGTFAPVRAERDVFDGGAGVDTLGYTGRRRGVVVDLASHGRDAGARGEGDSLRRLEEVVGTDGDDRLFGDESANALDGGAGDDLVVGRGGDDRLRGSTGSNRVRGDAGNDMIEVDSASTSPPLERQRVWCGSGRDRVGQLYRNDFAEDDCEQVVIFESYVLRVLLPPRTLRRPPLASMNECIAIEYCRVRMEVRLARSPDRRRPGSEGSAARPRKRETAERDPSRRQRSRRSPCISRSVAAASCGVIAPCSSASD